LSLYHQCVEDTTSVWLFVTGWPIWQIISAKTMDSFIPVNEETG